MEVDEPRIAAEPRRLQSAAVPESNLGNGRLHESEFTPASHPDSAPAPPQASTSKPARAGARAVREIIETLLLALVIFVGVRLIVLNFRVDGESMFPNLDNGEMLLVNRNVYFHFDLDGFLDALPLIERDGENIIYPFHPPERGDIVVFDPPVRGSDKPYIKRVIGLPGERVTFENGSAFIDGVQLNEPYIVEDTECRTDHCDVTVPEGHVYVLGDNRNNSSDSRAFGVVSVDEIIGKAWLAYWPADQIDIVDHHDYPEIHER